MAPIFRSASAIAPLYLPMTDGGSTSTYEDHSPRHGITIRLAGDRSLLEVLALTKRYGERVALADVAFSVHRGEVLGLIGPNGAGKTTLLEAVAGLLPVDAGSVLWHGRRLPRARR